MIIQANRTKGSLIALIGAIVVLAGGARAQAASPIKLIQANQIGWEVNAATKGNVCAIASDQCQPGHESSEPGGFTFPEGIAVTASGDFYAADSVNHRIQEFDAAGEFVLTFGEGVNATTHGNVCTEEEIRKAGVKCAAGAEGGEPGQFGHPESIAVDPTSGNLYVAEYLIVGETLGERVQEFTASGQFILEIGKEVNKTTKGNLCTQQEAEKGVTCGGPAMEAFGSPQSNEPGALDFERERGDVLAVGGEYDLLYVGEEGRIQKFEADGQPKGEISVTGTVGTIALGAGDLYVGYEGRSVVQEFTLEGQELEQFEVQPARANSDVFVRAIAVDPAGRIAVLAEEEGTLFGALYGSVSGPRLPGFSFPEGAVVRALGFDGSGALYALALGGQDVLSYIPETVAELRTGPATCREGAGHETSVTFDCSLGGEANPYAVAETHARFEWGGTCALGKQTAEQEFATVETYLPVTATIEGLLPNEAFCYRLVGGDQHVQPPEELFGEYVTSRTPVVRPEIVGAPSASFMTSSAAVVQGELNPENAGTEYFFEYAPVLHPGEDALTGCPGVREASCPGVASTPNGESALYGPMRVTVEASGLQADTTYRYRLAARNAAGESSGTGPGQEGTFTTTPGAVPSVLTGLASAISATSATVSGMVDPDGRAATYTFELGVYEGAATRYGVVFSGPAGTETTPTTETLSLTGLQPGTTYAYRIAVKSGYTPAGEPVLGESALFTTEGLPAVLDAPMPPELLAAPQIPFPGPALVSKAKKIKSKRGKKAGGRKVKSRSKKRRRKQGKKVTANLAVRGGKRLLRR
ncbi:MAG TPA: hypothetical protein VGL57_03625 [Solirubrobacteraceae bacterium]|jgi:hypothetical protein